MGKAVNKGFDLAKKAAVIGSAAVGAGLTYIAVQGTKLASDLSEVQNVVDTTFGQNSKAIDAWSVTALKSFGLSELSAKQYSSTMGAMLKSSGLSASSTLTMSKNLTALTGDMASFYNLDPAEAFEKIRSGISGETEPLKQLGVNMSVANLSAYAMSKGIKTSYDKMNQASQTALRYNYLLSVTKDAQGDFGKTSGSFANQLRVAQTSFQQLASKIMTAALPGLTKLLEAGNKLLDGAMGNPQFIKIFQDIVTTAMNTIIDLVPKVIGYFQQWEPAVRGVYNIGVSVFDFISNNWPLMEPIIWGIVAAQLAFNAAAKAALIIEAVTKGIEFARAAMIFYRDGASIATIAQWAFNTALSDNPVGMVIMAIGALVAIGVALYKNWDTITASVSGAWNWFTNLIKGMPGVGIALSGPLAPLLLLIKHFDAVKNAVSGAFSAVGKFFGLGGGDKSTGAADLTKKSTSKAVPKFASGGFSNQPSIFGEAGPEAAIPLKYKNPRSLSLLNQTARAIGADGDKGSGAVQLVYSPVIQGGSSNEIEAKLKSQAEEFKAWIEEYLAEKERVSFG
jgi:Flp pilus assembly pilin Flp